MPNRSTPSPGDTRLQAYKHPAPDPRVTRIFDLACAALGSWLLMVALLRYIEHSAALHILHPWYVHG